VDKSGIVFRNFRSFSVKSTNPIAVNAYEIITLDLSSYNYTKSPHAFISSTFLCSVTISDTSATSVTVTLYNLYGSSQQCSCVIYLFELNSV